MKMILSEEEVLRRIEMRVKTTRIVGTLCKVRDPNLLYNAMSYLDVWNDGIYISNPYAYVDKTLFENMTEDLFRIFIEYVAHWMPPFTSDEIRVIMDACTKYGYLVTVHKDRLSFRRDPTNENIRSRYRDRSKG